MRRRLPWVMACLLAAPPALAQELPAVGSRIRVKTTEPQGRTVGRETVYDLPGRLVGRGEQRLTYAPPGEEPITFTRGAYALVGEVVWVNERYITLAIPGDERHARVLREAVTEVAVSRGRPSAGRRAAGGAAIGAGLGLALGASSGGGSGIGPSGGFLVLASAAVLWTLGALIGAASTPSDTWEDVALARIRASLIAPPVHAADGRRLAVRLTIAF